MASSSADADRNLLFGILAVQMDFITQGQLIAAMHAWVLNKGKPLGQILHEQQALSGEHRQLLEAMVAAHIQQHAGDPHQSLAAVTSASSIRAELEQIADPDVNASLAHVCAARNAGPPTVSYTPTPSGLRYRILRPHAKGGLGEVFVAEDTELHREIALKEIQARHADDGGSRGRFVLEAEITGGLEHPGIVPVYGLGTYADGRPFYAMRFIKGDNLKEAIVRFHRSGEKDNRKLAIHNSPLFTGLQFRQLLGRFIDVCNAVAYAHSRGVLHRDLKPGNIMLGKFGETLVVDWGLAKVTGRGEPGASVTGVDDATLRPSSGSGIAETVAGTAVGTPAYMSPEQAAGKIDQLGPAADVYSLGATLFALITNRAPAQGADSPEVLRKVQRGDAGFNQFEQAAQASAILRPLVAVCKKAMALNPRDRYATPLALAEDIEHWLADEPVGAAPEPVIVRARRWMRKHPGKVSGIAASILVAVVGLTIGALLLGEKNRELASTNTTLENTIGERDTANAALKTTNDDLGSANKTLKATNEKLDAALLAAKKAAEAEKLAAEKEREATALAVKRLGHIEKANELLVAIFTDIDPRLEKKGGPLLIEQLRDRLLDAADKLDEEAIGDPLTVARLQSFLGSTLQNLGKAEKAIELHARARATHEKLLGPDHLNTLMSMGNLASGYRDAGKLELALPLYEETLRLQKAKLGPDHPNTLISMNNLALGYQAAGKLELALPLFEETLKLRKSHLGNDHPTTLNSMNNLASGYRDAGKFEQAVSLLEETYKLRKAKFGANHPDTIQSVNNLAEGYRAAGKLALALPLVEESYKHSKAKLGPDHPTTLTSMNNLAAGFHAAGKLELALPLYEETLKLRKAKLGPDHPDTLGSMNNLAEGYRAAGKLGLALPLYEETLKLMKAKLGPNHPDTLGCMNNLAAGYRDAGKLDVALALYEETLELRKSKLGTDHPDTLQSMNNLAYCYRAVGKLELALPLFEETINFSKAKLGADHPNTIASVGNLVKAYLESKEPQRALPHVADFVAGQRKRFGSRNPRFATLLTTVSLDLLKARQFPEAEKLLREAAAIRDETQPSHWTTFETLSLVGASLLGQKKYQDAEPLLLGGFEGMAKRVANIPPKARDLALQHGMGPLAELYDATRENQEFTLQGKLTDNKTQNVHEVKLTAGQAVVVLMNSNQFDTLVQLQDAKGKLLAENDDIDYAAKKTNSRLWFMPAADGVYRIVATSYQNQGRGDYEIVIRRYGPAKKLR